MRIDLWRSAFAGMTFAATFSLTAVAGSPRMFRGLPKPERVVDLTTRSDRDLQQKRTCFVYEAWVLIVQEVVEGDELPGIVNNWVGPRNRDASSIAALCRATAKGGRAVGPNPVESIVRDFLVVEAAEGLADDMWFGIQDIRTGQTVFESDFAKSAGVTVKPKGKNSLSVQFKLPLQEMKCNPSDPSCWAEMTRDLLCQSSFTWKPPQCPVPRPRFGVQAFVPVRVDDIRHPVVTPEPGKAICSEDA